MSRIQDCCFKTYDPCYYAAKNGHLECLQYAHENRCPWDKNTCYMAAKNGHLECLQYAHENRCPWDKNTCYMAAYYGQLECLRYAHENGCPWDEWVCGAAAYFGQLECLQYAHEHGCPLDKGFFDAVRNEQLDCLKYLITHEWKTWKQLKPRIVSKYRQSIQNINILNNSWTVSNYIFLAGMIQPSSYIYKHFYNHSLFDLNLINEMLSLL